MSLFGPPAHQPRGHATALQRAAFVLPVSGPARGGGDFADQESFAAKAAEAAPTLPDRATTRGFAPRADAAITAQSRKPGPVRQSAGGPAPRSKRPLSRPGHFGEPLLLPPAHLRAVRAAGRGLELGR